MKTQMTKYFHRRLQWRFRLICALVATLFFTLSAQAQDDAVLPPIGGNGGNRFVARCAQGEMLTGFDLRTGDDVDAIRPICIPTATGQFHFYPLSFGGNGGGPTQLVCPGDVPVVTGMMIGSEGKEILSVNNIHLFCGVAATTQTPSEIPDVVFDGPAEQTTGAFGTFVEREHDMQRCPTGLVAVGINGRSGKWLDAVGLICGPPPGTPQANAQDNNKPPPVALGRVHSSTAAPPLKTMGGEPPICARARDARARNSPVASDLETRCRAAGGNFTDRAVRQGMSGTIKRNAATTSHVGIFAPPPAAQPPVAQSPAEPGHAFMPPTFNDGAQLWACANAAQGKVKGAACSGLQAATVYCQRHGFSGALQTRADGTPDLMIAAAQPGIPVRAGNGDVCTANDCAVISELRCAP